MKTAWIGGGNGFIGHWMGRKLKSEGYWVRVLDIKEYEYGDSDYADEVVIADLRDFDRCKSSLRLNKNLEYSYYQDAFEEIIQFDEVYCFACQMGGAGYVFTGENDSDIMHDSVLINLNILKILRDKTFTGKIFYSSSACIYPQEIQNDYHNPGLKESDAYPLNPDSCYGLEKAFSERLFDAYARNYSLDVRIARFHNIYGPEGTYQGGREKAPAAMCRKVIECKPKEIGIDDWQGEIEVWGTGHQTRSFLYIDDCIDAVRLLMESDFSGPVNIGSEEMITINQLAEIAIYLSEKKITIKNISGPVGVMGRNSDNTLIREKLGWSPATALIHGMIKTYSWIESQYGRNK